MTSPAGGKPTVAELGIDVAAQAWRRSGSGDGAIEVAFARAPGTSAGAGAGAGAEWVLMRVTGDQEQRVLVFDRHEWECFLDGARKGEFDAAADQHAARRHTADQHAAGQHAADQHATRRHAADQHTADQHAAGQ